MSGPQDILDLSGGLLSLECLHLVHVPAPSPAPFPPGLSTFLAYLAWIPHFCPEGTQLRKKVCSVLGIGKPSAFCARRFLRDSPPATQPRTTRVGRVPQRGGVFPVPPLCAARSFPAPQRILFPDLSLIRRSPFLPGLPDFAL